MKKKHWKQILREDDNFCNLAAVAQEQPFLSVIKK